MQTAIPAFSKTDNLQACTGEGIDKREMVNKYFLAIPIITYIIILTKFALSMSYMSKLNNNPFKSDFKAIFYMFLFVPLGSIFLFPVYFTFLYLLRQQLKIMFVAVTFACLGLGLAVAVISGEQQLMIISGTGIIITAVWFYCMWGQIQMAVTTIKAGLVQLNRKKVKFFLGFFLLLALTTLALGFEITGFVNYCIMLSDNDLNDSQRKVAVFFLTAGSLSFIYQLELTAAIGYLYGAAFFNQFSLMKDGKIEKETSKEVSQVTNQAHRIAFKSSLGTACIGALLITIVRIITHSNNSSDDNSSLGAKIGGAICSCIAEALAFIATQAYVYSAIYGTGLFKSGKMALESFKTSGFDKFFNYAFSERILNAMALFFAALVGVGSGFISYKWGGERMFGLHTSDDMVKNLSIMIGFFVFFCIEIPLYTVNCILGGHTSAQIAMYVEDPDLLKRTHPRADKFTKLLTAQ